MATAVQRTRLLMTPSRISTITRHGNYGNTRQGESAPSIRNPGHLSLSPVSSSDPGEGVW